MLFHLACTLALAWPAFVNGQPFYFPDSTAYVRAADSAAYIFSGHRVRTEWTEHYARSLLPGAQPRDPDRHVSAHGNDLATDNIMSGRSPYFGALLWLGFVFGRFWLFVLAQAATAYALIRISLRLFGLLRPAMVAGTVAALAAMSSLPFFTSLLMPDLLAGFAILAFLLLAIDRGRLSRGERYGLVALMLLSAIAHLTHIVIIGGMTLALAGWGMVSRWPRERFVPLVCAGGLVMLVGLMSMAATSLVVEHVFGRKPLPPPFLTARFLADGPGLDYLRDHCPGSGFAVCAWRNRDHVRSLAFLWSNDRANGGYMLSDSATRRALAAEDRAFALAVLVEYPFAQGGRIIGNGLRQMVRFDVDLANMPCDPSQRCWTTLPARERSVLIASPAGRGVWPQALMAGIHRVVVGIAFIGLLAFVAARRDRTAADVRIWLALLLVAATVNALVCGGISEPLARYQARIIWLLPLTAIIAGLIWQKDRTRKLDG